MKALISSDTKEESKDEGSKKIYASAPPWQEDALNVCLANLGFNPVQVYRHPGV